jgi:L-aminopeptidase/D-esterase-like protein
MYAAIERGRDALTGKGSDTDAGQGHDALTKKNPGEGVERENNTPTERDPDAGVGALENTTLLCVVTNAILTKAQASRMATLAHDGMARAVRPVHTSADGDAAFALASCIVPADADAVSCLAADMAATAIKRAALSAKPAYGLKAAGDFR